MLNSLSFLKSIGSLKEESFLFKFLSQSNIGKSPKPELYLFINIGFRSNNFYLYFYMLEFFFIIIGWSKSWLYPSSSKTYERELTFPLNNPFYPGLSLLEKLDFFFDKDDGYYEFFENLLNRLGYSSNVSIWIDFFLSFYFLYAYLDFDF